MSRIIAGCSTLIDMMLGGMSICGGGEETWAAALVVTVLTVCSYIAMFVGTIAVEALEQPEVLPLDR